MVPKMMQPPVWIDTAHRWDAPLIQSYFVSLPLCLTSDLVC